LTGTGDDIELTQTVCAAVTYVFGPTNPCTPLFSITGLGSFGSGQALNGMGQGEVKGMTCAEVKDHYTGESSPVGVAIEENRSLFRCGGMELL